MFSDIVPTLLEVISALAEKDILEMARNVETSTNVKTQNQHLFASTMLNVAIYQHISFVNVKKDLKEMEQKNAQVTSIVRNFINQTHTEASLYNKKIFDVKTLYLLSHEVKVVVNNNKY